MAPACVAMVGRARTASSAAGRSGKAKFILFYFFSPFVFIILYLFIRFVICLTRLALQCSSERWTEQRVQRVHRAVVSLEDDVR